MRGSSAGVLLDTAALELRHVARWVIGSCTEADRPERMPILLAVRGDRASDDRSWMVGAAKNRTTPALPFRRADQNDVMSARETFMESPTNAKCVPRMYFRAASRICSGVTARS